jgi:Tripartite tricarboxylate transporter TctB family
MGWELDIMADPGTEIPDRAAALVLLAASIAYGLAALPLRDHPGYDTIGPAGFPILIAICGIILSLTLWLSPTEERPFPMSGPRVWPCWFAFAAYCVLVPYLGFAVGTFVFLLGTFILLDAPRLRAAATASIMALALWTLFKVVLEIRLAFGPWG